MLALLTSPTTTLFSVIFQIATTLLALLTSLATTLLSSSSNCNCDSGSGITSICAQTCWRLQQKLYSMRCLAEPSQFRLAGMGKWLTGTPSAFWTCKTEKNPFPQHEMIKKRTPRNCHEKEPNYFTSSYPHHVIYTFCYWQIFWHSIWHIFWHFIWHIFWHSIWHIFWHST